MNDPTNICPGATLTMEEISEGLDYASQCSHALQTLEKESFLVPTRCKLSNPPLWFDEEEVVLLSRVKELLKENL